MEVTLKKQTFMNQYWSTNVWALLVLDVFVTPFRKTEFYILFGKRKEKLQTILNVVSERSSVHKNAPRFFKKMRQLRMLKELVNIYY